MLLIISQLALLQICLLYAVPKSVAGEESEVGGDAVEQQDAPRRRPLDFWQWKGLGTYLEFLAALILVLSVLQLILGRFRWYIGACVD